MVDLLPTAEQDEIVAQTRSFLEGRLPATRLYRESTPPAVREHDVWSELAALGWFGMALAEEEGGAGLSLAEEALVFRELGRFLVSPAVLATALAARVAAAAGDKALANALVDGTARAAPVLGSNAGADAISRGGAGAGSSAGAGAGLSASASASPNGGARPEAMVLDARDADWLLAWNADGASLWRRDDCGDLRECAPMDRAVTLHRAPLPAKPALHVDAQALPLQSIANVLCAAMLVGIAEAVGEMAVAHAATREQFGKRIGEFQAVKHACADMRVRSEVAFWQVVVAALQQSDASANGKGLAAAAKVLAADAAVRNAAATIQVHGGMGFTADLGVDSYLRRAHLLHFLGGDTRAQRSALLAASLM